MENVGARGTDVSRNSSPQKKQDRFLRSNNTLSSREEDVSKGAKPTERGIVLCSRRLHLPLLWIRVTPGLGLHSQPIIRSRDNDYLKKKKKKRRFGPLEINNATSASPPFPSTWHSSSETNKATTRNSDCFRVCGWKQTEQSWMMISCPRVIWTPHKAVGGWFEG